MVEVTTHGEFEIATKESRPNGYGGYFPFLAWGKRGKIVATNVIQEPGEVYFNYGHSREEAREKVLKEMQGGQ